MEKARYQNARTLLAANTNLLVHVTETPDPIEEAPPATELNNTSRQLPFEREKQLADDLAFISATTNDSRKVMAVGLEECPTENRLTIRLASNTGDLSKVRAGLEGIAKTLERAALRSLFIFSM